MENSGFPKIHPRHAVIGRVRACVAEGVRKAVDENNPTYAELLVAVGQELVAWAAYQVEDEREKPEGVNAD